jgi:nucleoside-diphosphate-sugar epimerase
VHTAFARTAFGKDYAESLLYTSKLLNWIKTVNPSKFINISSQSVYGKIYQPMWTEQTPCAPDYNYAVAKFAAELIVNAYLQQTNINWTNIRLSSVCENARFVKFFVQNAIDKVDINVSAPNQMVSFIDVRDVAIGIGALIDSSKILKPVYNLGTGKSYTILDIANMVSRIGVEFGCGDTSINITGDADTSKIGMDNSLFCTEFNWCPKYSMEDSIKSLYEMLINPNGGGYPQAFKIVYNL